MQGDPIPNPGSDEAVARGCTCPVLDNGRGRAGPPWWYSGDCPVHVERATKGDDEAGE